MADENKKETSALKKVTSQFTNRANITIRKNIAAIEKVQNERVKQGLKRKKELDDNIAKLKKLDERISNGELTALKVVLNLISLTKIIVSAAVILYSAFFTFTTMGGTSSVMGMLFTALTASSLFSKDHDADSSTYSIKGAAVYGLAPAMSVASTGASRAYTAAKTALAGTTAGATKDVVTTGDTATFGETLKNATSTMAIISAATYVATGMLAAMSSILIKYYAGIITKESAAKSIKGAFEKGFKAVKSGIGKLAAVMKRNMRSGRKQVNTK